MKLPTYNTLRLDESRPGIVLCTLDRPERLNAMSLEMFDELTALCAWGGTEAALRVLVVTGAGRGFCAGLDLGELGVLENASMLEMIAIQEKAQNAIAAFRLLPRPVIAAVNGPAAGGGMALALAADIRLASPTARFNAAFVKIGLSGGDVGCSWMLPRIVGLGHASQILFTGRQVDAEWAARIGLVNEIVAADKLVDAALTLAEEIAGNSPLGMRLTKQVLQTNIDAPSLAAAIELEGRNQVMCIQTDDHREAVAAFREKRKAVFTGR